MGSCGFTIKDEPVENLRPLKVRVIGAGFSGILAAIRIPQKLRNVDLVVYEKNAGLGGVWWLNRYPGVACDIPCELTALACEVMPVNRSAHSYQYSFAPNPHWSSLYAPGPEIQQYLQDVAGRFGATRFIKTRHELRAAVWDEQTKLWRLTVADLATDTSFVDECHVLITARGQLSDMRWPDLPGLLDRFAGKVMHSGAWDDGYDFAHKRVAVIGNGSSAIQLVPRLQQLPGTALTVFLRSRTWITPPMGADAMAALGLDPDAATVPPAQQAVWAADADALLRLRKTVEDAGNEAHEASVRDTVPQQLLRQALSDSMRQALARRPDLFSLLAPDFAPGCRRLTPGRGYLEALMAANVEVVTGAVVAATETGVVVEEERKDGRDGNGNGNGNGNGGNGSDGNGNDNRRSFPVDAIVCATGFRVSEPPPFPVIGRRGISLQQRWADIPETYLSVAVNGFPNLFFLFGPNAAIGSGSLTVMLEAACDYVVQLIRKLQREDYASIEPRADRVADFSAYVDAYFRNTVYLDRCRSWYRSHGGTGDRIVGLWPGSTLHALEVLRSPRWEDFVYETADDDVSAPNRLRWLGNGRSVTQLGRGDPSWYLNPNQVDVPPEGRPEDDPRLLARPWSY
ncbi:monooxygenase-like protein [Grosmannia clavigera kw1407]|uniref:Monooxygenase-like protein n=1 Tax=Grosmannia clavigera (strain kw1407 / UAMH 11150) TaxID=655863 RepID=F0XR51_GROCL|nr:monooxygenase-like protein [Grosmannia clavigera kw1407]EFW99731.1 monooxygenase-like protein [Grosmannia clavigera kw1407]